MHIQAIQVPTRLPSLAGSGHLDGGDGHHVPGGRRARRAARGRVRQLRRAVPRVRRTRTARLTHVPLCEHRAPGERLLRAHRVWNHCCRRRRRQRHCHERVHWSGRRLSRKR